MQQQRTERTWSVYGTHNTDTWLHRCSKNDILGGMNLPRLQLHVHLSELHSSKII